MPVKMRLQRHGKKGKPFYHIVIADGRAPRDGKFIEKIGTYNPTPNPAEININFDSALDWLQKGAQPTDTVRAILSYKGILYKNHLLKGVKKGAFSEEQAGVKLEAWLKDKESRIQEKINSLEEKQRMTKKELLEAESKIREVREAELSKQKAAELNAKVQKAKEAATEKAETAVVDKIPAQEKTKKEGNE